MQILLISSKFPFPLKDGGAIATYQTYQGLIKLADNVHLLSFNTTKHHIDKQDIPGACFPSNSYSLIELNTKPNYLKAFLNLVFSKKPVILKRFSKKEFAEKLNQLLKTYVFDFVQIEGLYMLQYLKEIRQNSKAKIVYRAHNLEHQIWEQLANGTRNPIKRKYLTLLAKRILQYELFCLNKTRKRRLISSV